MASKTRLKLPAGAKERVAIDMLHVHEEMKVRADDKVGNNRFPLAAERTVAVYCESQLASKDVSYRLALLTMEPRSFLPGLRIP